MQSERGQEGSRGGRPDGAGITGVTAARTLEVNGVTDFLVLEAGDMIGGRIREDDGAGLEPGANWIHGLDLRDKEHHPIWREWTACDEDGPDGSVTPFDFTRVYNSSGGEYDIWDERCLFCYILVTSCKPSGLICHF